MARDGDLRQHRQHLHIAAEPHGRLTPDVYSTAQPGLRSRLGSRFAARARTRRHDRFRLLTGAREGMRIIDLGCGAAGLRGLEPDLDITGVDLIERPGYPGPFVQADVAEGLPFEDGAFDLAYASSVIEHVPPERRAAFAAELRRVARGWWVQTPAFSFPVEPHALLPFAHWLPERARERYWGLGVSGDPAEIRMMRRRELAELLPGGEIVAERVGPLAKSWISVRRPA